MKEKISVIIPAFKTEKYIKQCIDSVLAQSYKNFEIIVVYKKSDDNTGDILNSYGNKIRIVNQVKGALGDARNQGIDLAKGEYIFFLDSDDYIAENALELLIANALKNKSDMVMFPFYSIDNFTNKIVKNAWGYKLPFSQKHINKPFNYQDLDVERIINEESLVVAWNKLYKTKFIRDNKIYFMSDLRYEDNPFYYECLLKAKTISCLDKNLLFYRVNRENSLQSSSYEDKNLLDIVPIMKKTYDIFLCQKCTKELINNVEKYILSEFKWRYILMNSLAEQFTVLIKAYFPSAFYKQFEKMVAYNVNSFEALKEYKSVSNPKVSVILPIYNVENYIEDCLLSIVNQTLKDIEIICVNDCSKDNTIQIVKTFQLKDKRIKIVLNNENSGAGISRNNGIEIAQGKYISFMDPDDLYASNKTLEMFYNVAAKENYNLICGNIKVIEKDYKYTKKNQVLQEYYGYNVLQSQLYSNDKYDIWPSWGFTRFLYKRDFIVKNNIKFPNYRSYEDPLFLSQTLIKSQNFFGLKEDFYLYRYVPKHRKYVYNNIVDTLDSIEIILELYYENKLYKNYFFEYNNFKNFVVNDFKEFLNNKKENKNQQKEVKNKITSIIGKLDFSILNQFDDVPVISSYEDFYKKKDFRLGKTIKKYIKLILKPLAKPFYKRLFYRIENLVDDKIQSTLSNYCISSNMENINETPSDLLMRLKAIENERDLIINYLKLYDNKLKYDGNLIKYSKGEKIRAIFLFKIPSFWPSWESVYEEIKINKNFDFKVLLMENEKEKSQSQNAKSFLESLNIQYEMFNDEILDKFKPHIIFIQSPYDVWHRDESLYSCNLVKKGIRIIYIPYGIEISDEMKSINLQYKLKFFSNCWKIYTISDKMKENYCKYMLYLSNNVVATGHPKFDGLFYRRFTTNNGYQRSSVPNILLKLHFKLKVHQQGEDKELTPDTNIYIDFLNQKYRSGDYRLFIMLHPKFYDELSESEIANFNATLKASNATVILDEDYREILYNIDGAICDRSSILIELGVLDIPIMYMKTNIDEKMTENLLPLINSYESGKNITDIKNFIDSVIDKKDANKHLRKAALPQTIPYYDGMVAHRILNDIEMTLEIELDEGYENYTK